MHASAAHFYFKILGFLLTDHYLIFMGCSFCSHLFIENSCLSFIHIYIYVDVVPLMKTTGVVKNSGHCVYSI